MKDYEIATVSTQAELNANLAMTKGHFVSTIKSFEDL